MLTFATDNKGGIIYYYYKLQQIYCNIYLRPLTLVLQHITKGGLIIIITCCNKLESTVLFENVATNNKGGLTIFSITCCNRSTISSTVLFENVATYNEWPAGG